MRSVVLDQGLVEFLVSDVKEFLSQSQWYLERGTLAFFPRIIDS
jgi:hypothetical protein